MQEPFFISRSRDPSHRHYSTNSIKNMAWLLLYCVCVYRLGCFVVLDHFGSLRIKLSEIDSIIKFIYRPGYRPCNYYDLFTSCFFNLAYSGGLKGPSHETRLCVSVFAILRTRCRYKKTKSRAWSLD
jgi:hypothetical protein